VGKIVGRLNMTTNLAAGLRSLAARISVRFMVNELP